MPPYESSHRVLTVGGDHALCGVISARLSRLGMTERMVLDQSNVPSPPTQSTTPSTIEYAWADLSTFTSIPILTRDVDAVIIDLSSTPSQLTNLPPVHLEQVKDHQDIVKSKWLGTQRWVGHQLLGIFGRRGSPNLPLTHHSSWQDKQDSSPPPDSSPLSLGLSAPQNQKSKTIRPLTFLIPSSRLNQHSAEYLSAVAFDAYRRVGWRPKLLCYDWFTSKISTPSEAAKDTQARGDLSSLISFIFATLLTLRSNAHNVFTDLLEGRSSYAFSQRPISLITTDDLVSATMFVHQQQVGQDRYWVKGNQLTWGSLFRTVAYLIDDLEPSDRMQAQVYLANVTQPLQQNKNLRGIEGLIHTLRSTLSPNRVKAEHLLTELDRVTQDRTRVQIDERFSSRLTPLPNHFEWEPIHLTLKQQLDQIIQCQTSAQ